MTALLLTRCLELHAEVSRFAAAAGIEPRVLADPVEALAEWASATVVLVGDDIAADLAAVAPARRGDVHVVGLDPGDEVFRSALALGAESVLDLRSSGAHVVGLLSDLGDPPAAGCVIGVVGGAGGVGASTLACALGQGAARRGRTLVIDVDPLGPGLDRMLGLDDRPGVRWDDLHATTGRLGARALRESVPRSGQERAGPGVLTWAGGGGTLSAPILRETLAAARRGHELVVLDLARHGGATTVELVGRCQAVFVVARSSVTGLASATRLVSGLGGLDAPTSLVLRAGGVAGAEAERVTGLSVVHELGHQRGLGEAVDLGLGPLGSRRSPLARAVQDLLAHVAPSIPQAVA